MYAVAWRASQIIMLDTPQRMPAEMPGRSSVLCASMGRTPPLLPCMNAGSTAPWTSQGTQCSSQGPPLASAWPWQRGARPGAIAEGGRPAHAPRAGDCAQRAPTSTVLSPRRVSTVDRVSSRSLQVPSSTPAPPCRRTHLAESPLQRHTRVTLPPPRPGRFHAAGSTVIACGRRAGLLHEIQRRHPGIHTRECDVTDAAQRVALRDWAVAEFPKLNVLINNAGARGWAAAGGRACLDARGGGAQADAPARAGACGGLVAGARGRCTAACAAAEAPALGDSTASAHRLASSPAKHVDMRTHGRRTRKPATRDAPLHVNKRACSAVSPLGPALVRRRPAPHQRPGGGRALGGHLGRGNRQQARGHLGQGHRGHGIICDAFG